MKEIPEVEEIKKNLYSLEKERKKLQKQIDKGEKDGVWDEMWYYRLDEVEESIEKYRTMLDEYDNEVK